MIHSITNKYSTILSLLILTIACEDNSRDWNNRYDSRGTIDPDSWDPYGLSISRLSPTQLSLSWGYYIEDIDGFKIDRKVGENEWEIEFATLESESRQWDDTSAYINTDIQYEYNLYAYAGENTSSLSTIAYKDQKPTASILSISILNDSLIMLSWSKNFDSDFQSYSLYESRSENMINKTEIYYTDNYSHSSHTVTASLGQSKYYQIITRSFAGLESSSNITPIPKISFFKIFDYEDSNHQLGKSIVCLNDGGYMIAGEKFSQTDGLSEVWMIKTDSLGNQEWDKTFGGNGGHVVNSIHQTNDGGFLLLGYTYFYGNEEALLIKTNSVGDQEWSETFGGIGESRGNQVIQTENGNIAFVGYTNNDIWLCILNQFGVGIGRTFGGGIWSIDQGNSIQQTDDGGFIIAGNISGSQGDFNIYLLKTNSNGQEEWHQTFGDEGYTDTGNSVQQTDDGGFIITGQRHGNYTTLLKTDGQGNEEWHQNFNIIGWSEGHSVEQTDDGGYVIAGISNGSINIIKTDSQGGEQWNKVFETQYDGNTAYDVKQTDDGGYIVTGSIRTHIGHNDLVLIKLDSQGNIFGHD